MIVVGSTLASYKIDSTETNWLGSAEEMIEDAFPQELHFLAVLETDGRGPAHFDTLIKRLASLKERAVATWWRFELDDGARFITSGNRLMRICTGRNLIIDYALQHGADHVLFLDSDLHVPGESLSKLVEVNAPVVGGDVPSYCLSGKDVSREGIPLQEHWNTAGFLLVRREVLQVTRWGHDPIDGITDDPWFQARTAEKFGPTRVRKDVIGVHEPLAPLEQRAVDRQIY